MSVLSGVAGAVDGKGTVRGWTISSSADIQAIVASGSKQGTVLANGNTDWNGSYQAYGHTPDSMPTEGFTFTGSIDGTDGATGTAIVDSVEITIDIETGAVINHTVNFSGNGALTLGAAAAADATVPTPLTSIGTKVTFGTLVGSPVHTELNDVRTVTITITADNQSYVSSSTAGGVKRTAGNVSASIAISIYEGDPGNLPGVNSWSIIRVYVTSTLFWEFGFCQFGEESDVGADIEAGAIAGSTLNAQWSGFAIVDAAQAEGAIIKPDTNDYWPLP